MNNELTTNYEQVAKQYLNTLTGEKLTEAEQLQFIMLAKGYQLNPFKKQIYAIKFSGKLQIVVSYQVILSVATRHPDFGGIEVQYYSENKPVEYFDNLTSKLWAKVRIYKYIGTSRVIHNETRINFSDDYQTQRKNKFAQDYFTAWCEKLAHVAIVRKTYPEETDGMYTKDEFKEVEEVKTLEKPTLINNTKNEAIELVEKFIENDKDRKVVISDYLKKSKTKLRDWQQGNINLDLLREVIEEQLNKQEKVEKEEWKETDTPSI